MKPATLGEENNFKNVKIKIKDFSELIIQEGEWTDYKYNLGHFWKYVSFLLKLLGVRFSSPWIIRICRL